LEKTLPEILNELFETFDEQKEIIENLNQYTVKQTIAMRQNDLEEMKKSVTEQIYWAERLGSVGERHLTIREKLEKYLGLPPETDLSTILESIPGTLLSTASGELPGDIGEKILQAANRLSGMMQELKENIETNKLFAGRALGLYNKVLNSINQAQGESYNKDGKMTGDNQSLLNKKG